MINVCPSCGEYEVAKTVDQEKGLVTCPRCNEEIPFKFLPLYIVTGPSCVGKTTTAMALQGLTDDYVILDQDILWRNEFNSPETNYAEFRSLWLRLAKNIHQAGKSVILFGSTGPDQFEVDEARYFSAVHFFALHAEDELIVERCLARPEWRGSRDQGFIDAMADFNRWFRESGEAAGMTLYDVTGRSIPEVADAVLQWAADNS